MSKHVFVVFSEPTAGQEAEYNTWYDNQHLPDVLKVPGMRSARRFKMRGEPGSPPKYLALYEIDTPDLEATMAEIGKRSGTAAMPMSPALDRGSLVTSMGDLISEASEA